VTPIPPWFRGNAWDAITKIERYSFGMPCEPDCFVINDHEEGFTGLLRWLKLLPLLVLAIVGLPAVASAHGGHDSAPAQRGEIRGDWNWHQGVMQAPSEQVRVVETSHHLPGAGPCIGFCCCQGMVHCSASGCQFSALPSLDGLPAFDAPLAQRASIKNDLPRHLHCSSGLDRPPKA
jgi:hypothetical protein